MFLFYFYKFWCTCHQPMSVADYSWRVNHVKHLSTKSVVFKSWFVGVAAPAPWCAPGTVKLNVQKTVINNAHKIVHITETLFWNRIGPVSQILRRIFQRASATENESLVLMYNITITLHYLCNEVWCNPNTTSYHFSRKVHVLHWTELNT